MINPSLHRRENVFYLNNYWNKQSSNKSLSICCSLFLRTRKKRERITFVFQLNYLVLYLEINPVLRMARVKRIPLKENDLFKINFPSDGQSAVLNEILDHWTFSQVVQSAINKLHGLSISYRGYQLENKFFFVKWFTRQSLER